MRHVYRNVEANRQGHIHRNIFYALTSTGTKHTVNCGGYGGGGVGSVSSTHGAAKGSRRDIKSRK